MAIVESPGFAHEIVTLPPSASVVVSTSVGVSGGAGPNAGKYSVVNVTSLPRPTTSGSAPLHPFCGE